MTQATHPTVPLSARLGAYRVMALCVLLTLLATASASLARADGAPKKASAAAGKTETLRFFSKDVSQTVTTADGTVIRKAPYPEAQPGDILDANAVNYVGNHRRHAKRWSTSHHVRCVFAGGAPECESQVAIGGSLLIFRGFPGTLVNGTGRYQGATGRVIVNKAVKGGSDIVARIHLRAGAQHTTARTSHTDAAEPAWMRALRIRGEAMNRRFEAGE